LDSSWAAYGGKKYGPRAKDATPAQQTEIAHAAVARSGLTPWKASQHCWGSRVTPANALATPAVARPVATPAGARPVAKPVARPAAAAPALSNPVSAAALRHAPAAAGKHSLPEQRTSPE